MLEKSILAMRRGQANIILLVVIALGIVILATINFTGFSTFSTQPLNEETQIYAQEEPAISPQIEIAESPSSLGTSNATDLPAAFLIAPFYSSGSNPATENTEISITNVGTDTEYVRLFFVRTGCSSIMRLTTSLSPGQTYTFLTSDIDPNNKGYITAFTIDANGLAVGHNSLIGSVRFKRATYGHSGGYNMMGFRSLNGAMGVNVSGSGTLMFDGTNLEKWPAAAAAPSIVSRVTGARFYVVLVTPVNNLISGNTSSLPLHGVLYDDQSMPYEWALSSSCFLDNELSDNFPLTTPRFTTVIPAGRTGWMRMWRTAPAPLVGLYMTHNYVGGWDLFTGSRILSATCQATNCTKPETVSYNITYPILPVT